MACGGDPCRKTDRIPRVLLLALVALAGPPAPAAAQPDGAALYAEGCIHCHGVSGQGVTGTGPSVGPGRTQSGGPSLEGVGRQSIEFYLETGYMPLGDVHEQPQRRPSPYTADERRALADYVESLTGPGPAVPEVHPERGDIELGLTLFQDKCSGCHQVVGEGGVVDDAVAPELEHATATQVAQAIRIGPYVMPRFSERDLDAHEVDSIARYVLYTREPRDAGGWAIGHIGPIPEGLVAWLVGGLALVAVARLIGKGIGE